VALVVINENGTSTLVLPPSAGPGGAGAGADRLASLAADAGAADVAPLAGLAIERRTFRSEEVAGAAEILVLCPRRGVVPVVRLSPANGAQAIDVGDGRAGVVTLALRVMLEADVASANPMGGSPHVEVDYTFLSATAGFA